MKIDVIASEIIDSEHKRNSNLYNRWNKLHSILRQWAMFHADKQLLELLESVQKGEFDDGKQ